MKKISPDVRARVVRAAELRANGASWPSIAADIRRHVDTVRRWPDEYADLWNEVIVNTLQNLLKDSGAEAMLTLRQLLRSEDEKVRRDAARDLMTLALAHRRQQENEQRKKQPKGRDASSITSHLEELDDEQLIKEIRDLLRDFPEATTRTPAPPVDHPTGTDGS